MHPFTITAWNEPPTTETSGPSHHSLSVYVELFWLPTLGPSATWLLRRSAVFLLGSDEEFTLDFDWLATSLGLGRGDARHAPLPRAIDRCVRFDLAQRLDDDHLAIRTEVPALPDRHVARLDPLTQELHRTWHHRTPQSLAALESV
jgi:hypothetical protein